MPLPSEQIWLPGAGMLSFVEKRAAEAVEEYDADLTLGQRKDTGEWCAFLPGNRASGGQPFPVFSFGTELPDPDKVKRMLYRHDIKRNGKELMDTLDRIFDDEQKRIGDRTSEAAGMVAEAIDSNMRLNGTHPFPKVSMAPRFGGGRIRSSG